MESNSTIVFRNIAGRLIPVTIAILAMVIDSLPIAPLGGLVCPPLLALIPIYFWSLIRPDLMTPAWVFVLGLAEDMMSGGPPGVRAAAFVIMYAVVDRQREAFASLSGIGAVLGFATAALIASAAAYAVRAALAGQMLVIAPFASELAMTVIAYMVFAPMMAATHRKFVGALRSEF